MSRIVCGVNPVREAIRARPDDVEKIFYIENISGEAKRILQHARQNSIKSTRDSKARLDELAGNIKHQGILAVLSDFPYSTIPDIIKGWKVSEGKAFILVLDGIQDPHNLGAIIRSAEAAGIHGIIIPKDRAVSVTSTVEKVSTGAAEHVKIARVTNISRTLDDLKKEGIWVTGVEGDGNLSIYEADLVMDTALVIGSEGKGIRPLVRKKCDFVATIPMKGKINSLNASVSTGVVMYELLRQREFSPQNA